MADPTRSIGMGPGRILWFASYPKSGNTWLRMFLANLQADRNAPIRLNELAASPSAAGRHLFEDTTGLDSSELTAGETRRLRPLVYSWLSRHARATIPCKIHDALVVDGQLIIEPAATFGAIHVVRNPLDVAVSFADHLGLSIDATIERMSRDSFRIGGGGRPQLQQHLGSWSSHVSSWMDANCIAVMTVRYEDMMASPYDTFTRIAVFAGFSTDESRIRRAIDFSSFAEAQRQEAAAGFIERLPGVARFFRRGRVGAWRQDLTAGQAARLVESESATMARLGYLDANGQPAY
ncbi:MAG: sulfotransferase domain-containing protein [Gemmatimonadetes bacterium]|nr:sulfotransferase domain-containing protein [Gemmatimonadota bacterium]